MQNFAAVEMKLAEARRKLFRLAEIHRVPDFYDALNDFLTTARAIESVLAYQFGLKDLGRSPEGRAIKSALSPVQFAERQSFDDWLETEGKAVRDHLLKDERDGALHRSGQAAVYYWPKPSSGLGVEPGTPFQHGLVIRRGGVGLPLENDMEFFWQLPNGTEGDAVTTCGDFLAELESLVAAARSQPWR